MEALTSDSNNPSCEDAYRAAVEGEVEILMNFYMREPTSSINIWGDTIFHVLAVNLHSKATIELLNLSTPNNGFKTKNFNGNTALHEAARVGALEIVELMVQKEESLVHDSNCMGEVPLYWAVAWGQTAIFRLLIMKTTSSDDPGLRRNDGCTILHAAVMGEFYGLALEIIDRYPDLVFARDKDGITALHLLVQSPSSFKSGTHYSGTNLYYSSFIPLALLKLVIYFCIPWDALKDPCETENQQSSLQESRKPGMVRRLFRWIPWLRSIDDEKQRHKSALELAMLLIKRESVHMKRTYYIGHIGQPFQALKIGPSCTANTINDTLLLAARHGIVEVVDIILREYPSATEFVDDNGKNILHLAAEFYKIRVFGLLKSKGFLTTKMVANVDKQGNTALHLAAKFVSQRINNVQIPAYKMTIETAWFKILQGVSPKHMFQFRNSDGKTANELFDETHQHMINDSMKWIKSAANTCMVASTLIATMNFTAVFSIPGGYDQDTGLPVFAKSVKDLHTFYLYSARALFFSGCALAGSISVYFSRFHMNVFFFHFPLQYVIAGSSLFCSAIYTVITFVQALDLLTIGEYTTLQLCAAYYGIIVVIIMLILLYVDVMFIVFYYFVNGLINRIFLL